MECGPLALAIRHISKNASGSPRLSVPRASASGPVLENRSLTVAVLKAIAQMRPMLGVGGRLPVRPRLCRFNDALEFRSKAGRRPKLMIAGAAAREAWLGCGYVWRTSIGRTS